MSSTTTTWRPASATSRSLSSFTSPVLVVPAGVAGEREEIDRHRQIEPAHEIGHEDERSL
jgi:hypothetical protein